MEKVAAVKSMYKNVDHNLAKLIGLAGGTPVSSGDMLAIKINMCDARPPETGTITHPIFLDALLRYLRENYEDLNIYVVESDATVVLADEFIKWFGYMPVLERWGAKWFNLSKDEIINTEIKGNFLKSVSVPKILKEAKLISLSKLKTNSLSKITCSLKNQFGCLPIRQKSIYHDHLSEVIVDANLAMKPVFSIVDGILAMGGARGPSFGTPIHANIILAGHDPVAVDSACAKIIGYMPEKVKHIKLAEKCGLGSIKHKLTGDKISSIDFEIDKLTAVQSFVADKIKKIMRQSSRSKWKKKK